MLLVPCNNFIIYFFWVLLLSGLQKFCLHKSSFWWIVTQKPAFSEWEKSLKGSNSHLWPHFPENVKPLFLSKLQLSPKECLSSPKLRVDESSGVQPLLQPTIECHWIAWCLQPWSFFKQESWWAHSLLLCVLCCCIFFFDGRVFSQQLSVWYNWFCESLSWVCREIANILISSVSFCVFWEICFIQ